MSSILNKMKSLKKQKDTLLKKEESNKKNQFINHPVAHKNLELKIHYLNGLALMMNVEHKIANAERDFFISLMEAFELEKSILDNFIDFAKEPENEQIAELLEEIKKDNFIKFAFMIDNYRIAYKDGKFSDEEKELLEIFFDMLEFTKKEIDKINVCFKKIQLPIDYNKEFNNGRILNQVQFEVSNENKLENINEENKTEEKDNLIIKEKERAENGDMSSQINLAYMCLNGDGVEQNKLEAIKWFRKVANAGNIDAVNEIISIINSRIHLSDEDNVKSL